MLVSIDHIENGIAVLIGREDTTIRLTLPLSFLPPGAKEGDVLTLTLEHDEAGTQAAKDRIAALQDRLKRRQ